MNELSSIYIDLQEEYENINVLASDLYSSWAYGIYEDNQKITQLSYEVSLISGNLVAVICEFLSLDEFSYLVSCLIQSHRVLNSYVDSKDILDILKDRIKSDDAYNESEEEIIEKLEDYFFALINLLDLSENYPGSFSSLQDDIQKYRNVVNSIESDLEFDLG